MRQEMASTMLLPQAEAFVRGMFPGILDAAGLRDEAEAMRSIRPCESSSEVERACAVLSGLRDSARDGGPEWEDVVREAAFWGEAAVWAAASGDRETFDLCVGHVREAVESGPERISVH